MIDLLFNPKGVLVAGASSHPGKFGFVMLHNLLAAGYEGKVFATNPRGEEILGVKTISSISHLPSGQVDLVILCTPAKANIDLLRQCAAKGVRAAFVTSAGYGEAGADGLAMQEELVAVASDLGIALAGPNGQGVVSTPADLCAQIVAPYPPRGGIAIASQSGNFVSSFMNWSRASRVGVSRAVSAGNAAALGVIDYLDYYAMDVESKVGLAYLEGIDDGRELFDRMKVITAKMPVVVLKGGATEEGGKAAASHTGSLAADDRIFDGAMRQAGVRRAANAEEAFEAAATFSSQPLPAGNRVAVVTTAGGWGVATADAISAGSLELATLSKDLKQKLDELLVSRWSRNNPIDLAGGETRDTIPLTLEMVVNDSSVDAVIFLGLGIQSNQARLMAEGPFYPDWGLERIVDYHRRQDARFAQAAADLSLDSGKPILCATELAFADPTNPGPATVAATGRLCYASANRAVKALEHLWEYAAFLQRSS